MDIRNFDRGLIGFFAALCLLFYAGLLLTFPLRELIITLNGIFVGAMVAMSFAYWRLLTDTVLGDEYNRARHMALGLFIVWLAYWLTAASSIYSRASGIEVPSNAITVASRYFAIIGAAVQITSPSLGLGLFYGRDRRVLWSSIVAGAGMALFVIYAQAETMLEF